MIVCGFILPNYYLRYYGADAYGLVVSVTQYLSMISLCELGVGAVVQSAVYRPIHDHNLNEISKIYVAAQHFFRRIAVILGVYVIVLIVIFPELSKTTIDWKVSGVLIIIISAKTFLQYYFGITNKIILTAAQFLYLTNSITGLVLILNLILCIVLISNGFPLDFVLLISSVVFILQPLLFKFAIDRYFNISTKCKYDKNAIPQKWNGIAQHLATITLENSPTVVLTAMCPISYVAVYALYHMITNGMKLALTSFLSSFQPYLGNIIASRNRSKLDSSFLVLSWFSITSSILIFTIVAITIVPFLKIYTMQMADSQMYLIKPFGIWMCVWTCIYIIRLPFNYLVQAMGHFKETQGSAIIEAILNILCSIIAVSIWGISGVAIGMSVALLYRVLYFVKYIQNFISYSNILFFKILLTNILPSLTLFVLANRYFVEYGTDYFDWICYASKVCLCSIVLHAISNLLFFNKYMRFAIVLFKHK